MIDDSVAPEAVTALKSFVDRIVRLEEEKSALAEDIKNVYLEAKSQGFDNKALKTVVRLLKQDRTEREMMESTVALYLGAVEGFNE